MGEKRAVNRRLTRREVLLLGAVAGAGLALAGCGGGGPENNPAVRGQGGGGGNGATYDGPRVEIAFWNGWTGGNAPRILPRLIERFNSEHENIRVRNNTIQWEEYFQKVPSAVAAGRGPDVGVMHETEMSTFAARNVISPVDEMVEALGFSEDDFSPSVFRAGIYNGQAYGVPFSVTPLGLYYNRSLLERADLDPDSPPRNNDEYMAALERLKAAGIQGSWVDPFVFTGVLQFQSLLWQFGGGPYSADGARATFNSDAGVDALTWMVDLIKKGYSPKDVGQNANDTAFQNGENALMWTGVWQTSAYEQVSDLDWGAAPLPVIGNEEAAWSSSTHFVVFRQRTPDENRQQASSVFIRWFVDNSLDWAEVGELPASNSVRESEEFRQTEQLQPFAEQLPYVRFGFTAPGGADADAEMAQAVNEAVLLKKEPKAALDQAAERANQLLEENAQKYQAS